MKKLQIIGFGYVCLFLLSIYIMIANNFAINNVLIFLAIGILATSYFIRNYKSKKNNLK